jgi:subtilisin family serine protease
VPEAWQLGQDGEGVVVAVIDSLVQWDHLNLKDSLYQVSNPTCPGEINGWDFSNDAIDPTSQSLDCLGDGDTRISASEVSQLRVFFQDTFRLADSELLQKYPSTAATLREAWQCTEASAEKCSDEAVAMGVRRQLRSRVTGEFHGTTVAGVIVSQPVQENGIVGVAPRALGQPGPSVAAAIEAIGYAAERGADVINMSWGGRFPSEDLENAIADVLSTNPTIVLVASAGNEGTSDDPDPDQVRYPSALDGVISVGATNLKGERAYYSNYGSGLDVVAPGGDFNQGIGFLSTGGTFINAFWQGIGLPDAGWDNSLDQRGSLTWTQGTSFASPAVAGVVALMKAEDASGQLTRDQVTQLLKQTATYEGLDASQESARPSVNTSSEVYFFGSGLVNAAAAVQAAQEASR